MVDADIPDLSSLTIVSTTTTNPINDIKSKADASQLDTSLSTALSHLVNRLTRPLSSSIPQARLSELREALSEVLSGKYASSWDESTPARGSGYRSLICQKHNGLPAELRMIAKRFQVDGAKWIRALASTKTIDGTEVVVREEWEAWCDPGLVAWRYGSWEWEDVGFEPTRPSRGKSRFDIACDPNTDESDPVQVIWQATAAKDSAEGASTFTPARQSYAIPIRAPTVYQIPPTPSQLVERSSSPSLLPAASIDFSAAPSALGHSAFSTPESDVEVTNGGAHTDPASYGGEPLPRLEFRRSRETNNGRARSGHSGSHSTSSVDSSVSDANSGVSQLMTPGSRPASADIFESIEARLVATEPGKGKARGRTPSPDTPHASQRQSVTPSTVTGATPAPGPGAAPSTTPTVTPYDGGNVTVLGGGVRLGGSSRPSSVMSSHRTPIDRSRSPSISLASRALNSAVGPNSAGGPRKQRTRRRIMPTYLGSIHQPGVGGPINGVFSQFIGGQPPQSQAFVNGQQQAASPQMWQGPMGMHTPNMPRPPTQQAPRTVS